MIVKGFVKEILPPFKEQGSILTESIFTAEQVFFNKTDYQDIKNIPIIQEGGLFEETFYQPPPPIELLESD